MRKQTKLVAVLSAAALLAIGASMTSFAANNWVQEGEDWVYLNKDGEREVNVWRRSNDNYYYLNEDGIMARDTLVEDTTVDAIYYVDENGVRLTNVWKSVPNDDDDQVGDIIPDLIYYYFGAAGKAYRADANEKVVKEINGKYYMFDEEGRMLSGWQEANGEYYYLGNENEGWAYTEWAYLEPDNNIVQEDYDDLKWFYFLSNGKAVKDKSRNINGKYYHFNEWGIMDDDWYSVGSTTEPTAASGAMAFASVSGTQASGWVYTGDANLDADVRYDNEDLYWYYLVSIRQNGNVARSIPYNYQVVPGTDTVTSGIVGDSEPTGEVRAKVIKNKTYIFNSNGKMLKGFVAIPKEAIKSDESVVAVNTDGTKILTYNNINNTLGGSVDLGNIRAAEGVSVVRDFAGSKHEYYKEKGRSLVAGLYYFNEAGGSVQGQMMTGRTAIEKDGETSYYYFSKDKTYPGYAYINAIQDGYLYGNDGRCITADDGNNYMVFNVTADIRIMNKAKANTSDGTRAVIEPTTTVTAKDGSTTTVNSRIIVSKTGKVRTSGTVTIDGVKYTVANSVVIDEQVVD